MTAISTNGITPVSQFEAEIDAEVQQGIPEAFSVKCADSASWVLRRINAARQYAERVKVWAEWERRRAEREEQRLLWLFEGQLRDWAASEVRKFNGRRKSIALPGGVLGFRRTVARIVIDDEAEILSWAKEHCKSAIVVTERLSKSAFDEFVKTTGSIPDSGLHIEPEVEKFYIK